MDRLHALLPRLWALTGHSCSNPRITPVGGGSINRVYRIDTPGASYCCKLNSATKFPQMLSQEAEGLRQLAAHVRTPLVYGVVDNGTTQALLLEWIPAVDPTPSFWQQFGKTLAAMHQHTAPQFGAAAANYMGAVPQVNTPAFEWPHFFGQQRLLPLATQCYESGLLPAADLHRAERLSQKLGAFFDPITPRLVHGDLWSGNFLCAPGPQPVLIDPAVYYGHPAVDLAMTTLFGGFDAAFYDAYHYYQPFPANYQDQWAICNLYPLLVHLRLFGGAYLPQVQHTLANYAS